MNPDQIMSMVAVLIGLLGLGYTVWSFNRLYSSKFSPVVTALPFVIIESKPGGLHYFYLSYLLENKGKKPGVIHDFRLRLLLGDQEFILTTLETSEISQGSTQSKHTKKFEGYFLEGFSGKHIKVIFLPNFPLEFHSTYKGRLLAEYKTSNRLDKFIESNSFNIEFSTILLTRIAAGLITELISDDNDNLIINTTSDESHRLLSTNGSVFLS